MTLKHDFKRLLDLCNDLRLTHPWAVVIALHDVARTLWPADPHLPFAIEEPGQRIRVAIDRARIFLYGVRLTTAYRTSVEEMADSASNVYGECWAGLSDEEISNGRLPVELSAEQIEGDVLDAGCGSGRHTIALAKLVDHSVIGIDLDEDALSRAWRLALEVGLHHVVFAKADLQQLPFEDERFGFVFCNGVIHHVRQHRLALRELCRVLRPGGRGFIYVYGRGGFFWHARQAMRPVMQRIPQQYTRAVLALMGLPRQRWIFMDTWYVPIERHYGRGEIETMLAEAGFEYEKVRAGRPTDLDQEGLDPELWGEGEHRYMVAKARSSG